MLQPSEKEDWSFNALVQAPKEKNKLVQWWFSFTAVPEPPPDASFETQELARRSYLMSSVLFFFLIVVVAFIVPTLFYPDPWILWLDLSLLPLSFITMAINHRGHPRAAGTFMIICYEFVLIGVLASATPMRPTNVQFYDICAVGVLLTAALLPPKFAFVTAAINSLYVVVSLLWQPHTPSLNQELITQFWPVLAIPVGLEFLVATFSWVFVENTTKAITRANKAETVARLEHQIAEDRAIAENEKEILENSLRELIKAHVEATNGDIVERIPYPRARVLWPLVGAINSLWVRTQKTDQAENSLQHLRQAIILYARRVEQESPTSKLPLPIYRSGTDLDALISILARRNKQNLER